jgi:transcriptional regulator with XRE-family HTH domain
MKYEKITEFILQERKRQKITKEDMSGILSISPTTIYKIEHNISQAKYKTLETILNSLGYELVIKKR